MACLFGHQWDGCKCGKCGKTRDEGHNFIRHDNNDCKCERCGKQIPHNYVKDANNEWDVCTRCGHLSFQNVPITGCRYVIDKITDKNILREIATGKDNVYIRYHAAIRLDDKYIALEIVEKDFQYGGVEYDQARKEVFGLINDNALLIEIARSHPHYLFKREAVYRISDQKVLLQLGKSETNREVLEAIISRLDCYSMVSVMEQDDINDFNSSLGYKFWHQVENNTNKFVESGAINNINREWILRKIAGLNNEASEIAKKRLAELSAIGKLK